MNKPLRLEIQKIVQSVPSGCIFDSHFVIAALWEQPSDEYFRYCATFLQMKGANAQLAKEIGKCAVDGQRIVERIKGVAWSNTIRHKPDKCACWRRLPDPERIVG